jgi:hypothetical protein
MKCTKCGCYFCWLCNAKVDAGTFPTHYQWWNLAGCPNMQMNESIAPSRGDVFRAKGLAVLQVRMRKHLIYTVIIVERSEDY